VERDRLRRQSQSRLGEGPRGCRSRQLLHPQLFSHEIKRSRKSEVRGGLGRPSRQHHSSAESRGLRVQRREVPSGRPEARSDSDARDQEECGLSSPSRDGISENGELRDSLAEQICRDVREEESCRDGFQHDNEAVRTAIEMQVKER